MKDLYTLTMTNISKDEAKEMVEELFGLVIWGRETLADGTEVLSSYPNSDGCATIAKVKPSSDGSENGDEKK